ncbi:MAG: hypothetical protein IT379_42295 [Deltaproteobacteria bacterium]|nr:hypothetical protein [Deltaproteobacteria bacterium]
MRPLGWVAVSWLVACGETSHPATDASVLDAATDELEWPELSIGTAADPADPRRLGPGAMPADLSCLGVHTYEPPGPLVSATITVAEFQTGAPAKNACVHVSADGRVVASDDCLDEDPRADAMGRVTADVAGAAPFAVRVFAMSGATDVETIDETLVFGATAPERTAGVVYLSQASTSLIAFLLGRDASPSNAAIGMALGDCAGRGIYGARVRVARADGTYVAPGDARTDPRDLYFDVGNLPSRDQPWTHLNGFAGMLGVPVEEPGEDVLIEVWGRPAGEGQPRVIACERLQIVAGATSIYQALGVLRPDGPQCPGLR